MKPKIRSQILVLPRPGADMLDAADEAAVRGAQAGLARLKKAKPGDKLLELTRPKK